MGPASYKILFSTLVTGLVLICSVSSGWARQSGIVFTDVAVEAGLGNETYSSRTVHNLGIDWIDYNDDSWPDLFAVNGIDDFAHLYQNNADGTFTTRDDLLPVLPNIEMAGAVFADYDNDGDQDIYIFGMSENTDPHIPYLSGGPPNILLKNLWVENGNQEIAGQPLFEDVAVAAQLDDVPPVPFDDNTAYSSLTGGWVDIDRDGCIDLFVGELYFQVIDSEANHNHLYHNRCDGTFNDATKISGVNDDTDPSILRPTLAFFGGFLDEDLDPDLYVVNTQLPSPYHFDLIYLNNGDGTFREVTGDMTSIGDDTGAGMGIDVADVDLDGDWDIYITDADSPSVEPNPGGNVLYLSNGDGTWQETSAAAAGVEARFSWGTNFLDIDQDHYEDLFVATRIENLIFRNNGDGTFEDVSATAGMTDSQFTIGSAVADYDHDGDLDIATIGPATRLVLYRNDTPNKGGFLEVDLNGVQSNRSAIGTFLKVKADSLSMRRQIVGGSSAHSQNELLVHFGLGDLVSIDSLIILWPSGVHDNWLNLAPNQRLTIGENEVQPWFIAADPVDSVIVIPPAGGNFDYDVSVKNLIGSDANTDIWIQITGPGTTITQGPISRTISAGQTISTTLSQGIPSGAPAGSYNLAFSTGTFPVALFIDSFSFTKTAAAGPSSDQIVKTWASTLKSMPGKSPPDIANELLKSESNSSLASGSVATDALLRNYPNPFTEATKIDYSTATPGLVRLLVYDMLGREVAVLENGWRSSGRHTVRFDAGNLPGGMYLYKLNAGGTVKMRSMIRIR